MTSKEIITANITRIIRVLIISPVFIPYIIILWVLAILADELVRSGMIRGWIDNQLNNDESILNAMVRFINWEY